MASHKIRPSSQELCDWESLPSQLGGGVIVLWRCVSDVQGDDEMREAQRSRT